MTAALLVPDGRPSGGTWGVLTESVCRDGRRAGADPSVVVVSAAVLRADGGLPVVDRHVRAGAAAPRAWRMAADVLVVRGGAARAAALARRCPGALVVAASREQECWVRIGVAGGMLLRLREAAGGGRAAGPPPWPAWASLVHAWLVAGLPAQALASASAHLVRAGGPSGTAVRGRTLLLRAVR